MTERATVISGNHNVFTVAIGDFANCSLRQCTIKGKVLGQKDLHNALAPGDEVEIEGNLIVQAIPRRNGFYRWNGKSSKRQLIASNVDAVLLVTTPANPPFRPRFIDRALVQCDADGLTPWIVCNKCDLEMGDDFRRYVRIWETLGVRVFFVSAITGSGIEELKDAILSLRGSASLSASHSIMPPVAVLIGQSGVGKSSVVNALGANKERETGALCTKYDRGAHTTAMGCMVQAGEGAAAIRMIDTPGVRQFALHNVEEAELAMHFAEMSPLVGKCRYGMSCTHTVEPGCAIIQAVAEGNITQERYDSYIRMREERGCIN